MHPEQVREHHPNGQICIAAQVIPAEVSSAEYSYSSGCPGSKVAAFIDLPRNTDDLPHRTLCGSMGHLLPVGNNYNLHIPGKRNNLLRGIATKRRQPFPITGPGQIDLSNLIASCEID